MGLFKKKAKTYSYDKERMKPVIKTSICTGEQVAGFKDIHTRKDRRYYACENGGRYRKI